MLTSILLVAFLLLLTSLLMVILLLASYCAVASMPAAAFTGIPDVAGVPLIPDVLTVAEPS